LWVYYASVILFAGAEFTQVYTKQTSGAVATADHAAPVTEEQRAQEGMDKSSKGRKETGALRH
jgi:membrane protein